MRCYRLSIAAALALAAAATAQPTALTYQGRLKNAGQPASGLHDFRFRLFDAAQGGNQLGDLQCLNNITVADGLFTASIDFGPQFASPGGRFLEIQVREDTGLNCNNANGFVTLSPRQPLTPAPVATHANAAFALDAADGGPQSAVFVNDEGRVGIGTQTPGHSVTVATPAPTIALQDTDGDGTQVGFISFRNASNAETAWMGFGTPGSPHFSILNARPGGNIALMPLSGRVGIGTETPNAKLEVRGSITLGNGGEYFAPACDENLRIVRGTINADGAILEGKGFSCQHLSQGDYLITFTTPFADAPTITASPDASANISAFYFATVDHVSQTSARVYTTWFFDNDFTYTDRSCNFIAVGPR